MRIEQLQMDCQRYEFLACEREKWILISLIAASDGHALLYPLRLRVLRSGARRPTMTGKGHAHVEKFQSTMILKISESRRGSDGLPRDE